MPDHRDRRSARQGPAGRLQACRHRRAGHRDHIPPADHRRRHAGRSQYRDLSPDRLHAGVQQIIGRGTRLFIGGGDPAADELTFDIIDFVEATRLFRDPGFDGPPLRVVRDETDQDGHLVESEDMPQEGEAEDHGDQVAEPAPGYQEQEGGELPPSGTGDVTDPDEVDEINATARRRYYVDGVEVLVWNESFYVAEGDGRRLVLVEYRDYVGNQVRKLDLSADDLRARWSETKSRSLITEQLAERGVDLEELAERTGEPDVDPIDLILHIAWEMPLVTRAERARRVRREHRDFIEAFASEARHILDLILEKYAEHGPDELSMDALLVPPFDEMGTITELADRLAAPMHLGLRWTISAGTSMTSRN